MNKAILTVVLTASLTVLGACNDDGRTASAADNSTMTDEAAQEGHDMQGMDATASGEGLPGSGPWTVTATNGIQVTLESPDAPFEAGPTTLMVSVQSEGGDVLPRSIDLTSPTMPMHGMARYPVVEGRAEVDIPMEGLWAVYVNLDESGTNSAEFLFGVSPSGSAAETHNH